LLTDCSINRQDAKNAEIEDSVIARGDPRSSILDLGVLGVLAVANKK